MTILRDREKRKLFHPKFPLPYEAIAEMKEYIVHGDLSEIAEEMECSVFKVWDCLNRERAKYDIDLMVAILERAERNMTVLNPKTKSRRERLSLRMYINKIYRHYSKRIDKDV